MVSPLDDLDLTQAHAYALQPADLLELLATVEASLAVSVNVLSSPSSWPDLQRALHDLNGYLGLVASTELTQLIQEADLAARHGDEARCRHLLLPLVPRLEHLRSSVQVYRTGIIGN